MCEKVHFIQQIECHSFLAWGYGVLSVTIISMASVLGAFMMPCMSKAFYKKFLFFMVSLAVGVLGGSASFHLIPHVSLIQVLRDPNYFSKLFLAVPENIPTLDIQQCVIHLATFED